MKRDRVARSGRHDPRARVAELADAQDLGSCPARGEGSNPSSRTPPSEAVRLRQNHANYKGKPSSTPVDPIPSSRQYPNESGSIRPLTATQNATRLLPDDPGLAAMVDAWPRAARGDSHGDRGDGQGGRAEMQRTCPSAGSIGKETPLTEIPDRRLGKGIGGRSAGLGDSTLAASPPPET
jgi:hypothetical protein